MSPQKKRKKGPISKEVENLCVKLYLMNGNEDEREDEFIKSLRKLVEITPNYHAIATSLRRHAVEFGKGDSERAWKLADRVNPAIRRAWEKYYNNFFK